MLCSGALDSDVNVVSCQNNHDNMEISQENSFKMHTAYKIQEMLKKILNELVHDRALLILTYGLRQNYQPLLNNNAKNE